MIVFLFLPYFLFQNFFFLFYEALSKNQFPLFGNCGKNKKIEQLSRKVGTGFG